MTMLRVLTGENTFFLFNLSIAMTIFFPLNMLFLASHLWNCMKIELNLMANN